jgi:O-antigen/teichoic acid export membrane protein
LFANEILYLMTTPDYYPAAAIIIFLTPAILLSNMYIFAPGIGIAKKTHLILYVNIVGATLNIILNWMLIPKFGISGAAIATLLSYASIFFVYMRLSQKLYFVPHKWRPIFFALIVTSLLAYWVPKLNMPFSLGIVLKLLIISLMCIFYVIVGLIKSSEIRQVQTELAKRFFS